MVFVNANAVESHPLGELHLVEILVVELMSLDRVEKLTWNVYPYAGVVLLNVLGKKPVGHQVKKGELHR